DPRFDSLSRSEIADIGIEITVLGQLEKIREEKDIIVGKHGLYIIAKGRAGVLLPQVATEYGWDARTFLENVCLKAGLPPSEWKNPDTQLYAFEGLVFAEKV
ncbi:MAG TPA: TIGR00296 family protein, partial [Rectinemataceae bacterium]|nr:TIGR00296 family protein [Rectinemataceae bacterium]